MMTSPLARRTAALLLSSLVPATLSASGIRTGYKDADAIARGNAFAATADNPAAIYYNPAGLTQLDGSAFSASAYVVQLQSDYSPGAGPATSMKRETHALPQFYYAHAPSGANYAFGLGAYVPFGLATDWPNTSGFNTIATKAELTDYAVTAVGAWKISPELSIGIVTPNPRRTVRSRRNCMSVTNTNASPSICGSNLRWPNDICRRARTS